MVIDGRHGHTKPDVQRVLNASWPPNPRSIGAAPAAIPVQVRVVFDRDGEQVLNGRATRWTNRHVFVEVADRRLGGVQGVWLAPADVTRLEG